MRGPWQQQSILLATSRRPSGRFAHLTSYTRFTPEGRNRDPYNALLDLQLPISSNIDDEATHEVNSGLLALFEICALTFTAALPVGLRGSRPRWRELRDVVRS